jgi:hypothetical protein
MADTSHVPYVLHINCLVKFFMCPFPLRLGNHTVEGLGSLASFVSIACKSSSSLGYGTHFVPPWRSMGSRQLMWFEGCFACGFDCGVECSELFLKGGS